MREIKFRAWLPERKIMLYDGQWFETRVGFADSGGDELLVGSKGAYLKSMYANHQPMPLNAILMQYTGLKDKNGREIYEGDILRFKHWELLGKPSRTAEVTFVQDHMNWILCSSDNSFTSFHKHDDRQFEVIGTIHENPDILKPKGSEE